MAIDSSLYTQPFSPEKAPLWHCPTCKKGLLDIVTDSFIIEESVNSKNDHENMDWEPDWIHGSYIGKLVCNNHSCEEAVFTIGRMQAFETQVTSNIGLVEFKINYKLFPHYFRPVLNIFNIDNDVPGNIKKGIENVFAHFWVDSGSCANKIRSVVEQIMDDKKVAKTHLDKKGKRHANSLHKKIELFSITNPELGDLLMAVKWIGNSGSHLNEILDPSDILDVLDILQHITHKLYEKESSRIKKLGNQINKTKGKLKKSK